MAASRKRLTCRPVSSEYASREERMLIAHGLAGQSMLAGSQGRVLGWRRPLGLETPRQQGSGGLSVAAVCRA